MYTLVGIHIRLSTHSKHLPHVRRASRLCQGVLHDRVQLCRQISRGWRCRLYLNTGVSYFVSTGSKVHFPTVIAPLNSVLTLTCKLERLAMDVIKVSAKQRLRRWSVSAAEDVQTIQTCSTIWLKPPPELRLTAISFPPKAPCGLVPA